MTSGIPGSAAAGERLAWALFIAAAAHGLLILGIGFTPPQSAGPEEVPTLEVTLLDRPTPGQPAPEVAQYLAQANQQGTGNVEEELQPEFHEHPPAPEREDVMARGLALEFAPPEREPARTETVASWASPLAAPIAPTPAEAEARPAEMPPEGGVTRVTAAGERELFISVNARESVFAEYLATWKARMERLGTVNFPAVAGVRGASPVLEVAIAADGSLREVQVTRSSGHSALDQAALDLVRLGSPFDPFPAAVRAQYDVLRFAYEWRFIQGRARGGTLRAPAD